MTELEQERLLARWEPCIRALAYNLGRQWGVARDEYDDLMQDGRLAVVRAAPRANGDAKPYYYKSIMGAMRRWLRDKFRLIQIPAFLQEVGIRPTTCYLESWLQGAGKRDGEGDQEDEEAAYIEPGYEQALTHVMLESTVGRACLTELEAEVLVSSVRDQRVAGRGRTRERARAKMRAAMGAGAL